MSSTLKQQSMNPTNLEALDPCASFEVSVCIEIKRVLVFHRHLMGPE